MPRNDLRAPRTAPHRAQVFINGRFLTQRITGVQRYARETLLAMDELLHTQADTGPRWTLLVPRGTTTPPLRAISTQAVGRLQGHAWEQLELPWHARGGALLGFGFTGPLLKRRQCITLHDAAVVRLPAGYSWRYRAWIRAVVGWVGRRAPLVMAVSHFSAAEATAAFGVPAAKLRVGTEGWQHLDRITPDESVLDRHSLRHRPFALAVSSPTPNKNFAVIARALSLMGEGAPVCAVVGAADNAVFSAGSVPRGLLRLGYVSDAELKALYQHAACFVFPSFYEGFGLPAIEAMACGCPVIASTAPALREVCGDAALFFDPRSAQDLATLLGRVFAEASAREGLRAQGLVRAQAFSWAGSARLNLAAVAEGLAA